MLDRLHGYSHSEHKRVSVKRLLIVTSHVAQPPPTLSGWDAERDASGCKRKVRIEFTLFGLKFGEPFPQSSL
jgi:hypothetical protein